MTPGGSGGKLKRRNEGMRIQVIGYKGVVGGATYELLKRLGHEVTGSDKGEPINRADIYVICTPEGNVPEVVRELLRYNELIVVRSTTPPGTIIGLIRNHGRHICHWPEHLREATALWDCYFPSFINI